MVPQRYLPPTASEINVAEAEKPPDDDFLTVLEEGIRAVLKAKKCSPAERIQAVTAGAKLLMIKFRISADPEKGFFE